MTEPIDVTIVGGGMITHDLILPTLYDMQRAGWVGVIRICALNSPPLRALAESRDLVEAFPGQAFIPHPALDAPSDAKHPDLYRDVIAAMKPRQVVFVAMPDPLHFEVAMEALRHNQHVACVKPLVLRYQEAVRIEQEARERGLFVGVEYHKRFDRRSLLARREYRLGYFGEFVMGEARLIEPYFYRSSNFQNWFTCNQTDPFVYVGCHYVDLACFITGLRPIEVSVEGVEGRFPNGNKGYMWTHGRVRFENDALLSVVNGLGYPDDGAGSNDQGIMMFCEGNGKSGMIRHNDQNRGMQYSYLEPPGEGARFRFINPDFFRFVPWEGEGFRPIGYGPDSVAALLRTAIELEASCGTIEERRACLARIDAKGLLATPANSSVNELVIEAARASILSGGSAVRIHYDDNPHIEKA